MRGKHQGLLQSISGAAAYHHDMTSRSQSAAMGDPATAAATKVRREALLLSVRRHPLVREVDRQLAHCGLTNDEVKATPLPLVIGVSGGPDSVALLLGCLALHRRKKRDSAPLAIIVAHVNHHLRESADADERWVVELCHCLSVPVHVEHVRPSALKGNVCANARRLRYQALVEVAKRVGAEHVAVAHHAEDQLETMLMALCRGAGPRGLTGMRPTRRIEGITLVRPLLHVRKRDCEDLCSKAGIVWRDDPSNVDVTRRRARLRRDVTPVLEELWPGAARRAAACARMLALASDALERAEIQ
jgi:tRNA(Ile)-lysidine synthase